MKQCLFNTQSDNVVAFCKYHNCYMTVRQMNRKECQQKQCKDFVKKEGHQYWHQQEVKKKKRKARKEKLKMVQGV